MKKLKHKFICVRCSSSKHPVEGLSYCVPIIGYRIHSWATNIEVKNFGFCLKCAHQLEEYLNLWWGNR